MAAFSIASSPSSPFLEFYIEVFDEGSWTHKLYEKLRSDSKGKNVVAMEVLGPYGTALVNQDATTNVLAIGAGTGIVPILSMFQEHVKRMLLLDPAAHLIELQEAERTAVKVKLARQAREAPVIANVATMQCCSDKELERSTDEIRKSMMLKKMSQASVAATYKDVVRTKRELRVAGLMVTRSIYGAVLQTFIGAYGIMVIGLVISWNTMKIPLYQHMTDILQIFTIILQAMFAVAAIFCWRGRNFFAYVDICMVVIAVFSDWYWNIIYDQDGTLPGTQITTLTLLLSYMTLRIWSKTVQTDGHETRGDTTGLSAIERLDVVWIARSAKLISRVLPDINRRYESLVKAWGEEYAKEVCRVSVYVTDKDPQAVETLKSELQGMVLHNQGLIKFGRPDIGELIEGHTLNMIETRSYSTSLLAFCGSPQLSSVVRQKKIANEIVTATTGFKNHTMDFISESYGGIKAPVETAVPVGEDVESGEPSSAMYKSGSLHSEPTRRVSLSFPSPAIEGDEEEIGKGFDDVDSEFMDRSALLESYSARSSILRRSSRRGLRGIED